MSDELKNSFDILDINTKRNQLNKELLVIYEIIKKFEESKNITPLSSVKNYDIVKDKNLTESEMLTFFYEDIYNIQQELITLLNIIEE